MKLLKWIALPLFISVVQVQETSIEFTQDELTEMGRVTTTQDWLRQGFCLTDLM